MSWEEVAQDPPKSKATAAPLALSLVKRGAGNIRLYVTVSPALCTELGWQVGEEFGLAVGRGANAGTVRIMRKGGGRPMRTLPRSEYRSIELMVSADLAGWQAPRRAAEYQVQRGGVLVSTLPWTLEEAPAAEDEDQEAAAA